ncbi:sulfurtransferase-like selenium metabolism protein YedF [Deferribacter thermophilus]|uniref:sulfurtransferase-like selenium metabolism protein YedF n=1 Tax=Deferribacter thermophilus TaxID=53573 RepID=UPI003C1BA169
MVVDARGEACPTPVILTKKALESIEEGVITVLVDNLASKENVSKYASSQGLHYEVNEKDGYFEIVITKGYTCDIDSEKKAEKSNKNKIVLHVVSDSIGLGNEELGKILMKGFIENIINLDRLPTSIIFVNSGVFLTTKNEDTIKALKELEAKGVEILSCGTCLNYYNLIDELKVGEITDGFKVMQRLFEADKVIRV